jgi:hypothetical protein
MFPFRVRNESTANTARTWALAAMLLSMPAASLSAAEGTGRPPAADRAIDAHLAAGEFGPAVDLALAADSRPTSPGNWGASPPHNAPPASFARPKPPRGGFPRKRPVPARGDRTFRNGAPPAAARSPISPN